MLLHVNVHAQQLLVYDFGSVNMLDVKTRKPGSAKLTGVSFSSRSSRSSSIASGSPNPSATANSKLQVTEWQVGPIA